MRVFLFSLTFYRIIDTISIYLNIDVMAAAIFGACFALLFTYLNAQRKAQEG